MVSSQTAAAAVAPGRAPPLSWSNQQRGSSHHRLAVAAVAWQQRQHGRSSCSSILTAAAGLSAPLPLGWSRSSAAAISSGVAIGRVAGKWQQRRRCAAQQRRSWRDVAARPGKGATRAATA
eukprot:351815-Chlamydomonas_euryale.AAC.5